MAAKASSASTRPSKPLRLTHPSRTPTTSPASTISAARTATYRKYRIIYVDRVPYAYHLAISRHWLVHYFSADMLAEPWKREEERAFLENPVHILGPQAMAAITAIGHRLDLDYGGIDFSILPDGRVLIFEANATMLVHLKDSAEDFPYKHQVVPKIFAAFDAMLDRAANPSP